MGYIEKRNQIDILQEQISLLGELTADVKKKIDYKFRLDWNYYSNSMEGNTLTMDETRSVMVGNLTVGGKPIKDVLEMKGHDEVIGNILKIGKGEMRLSEKRIQEIHKGIMHEEDVAKRDKIGKWKTEPNYLFNYKNERFDFVAPAEVPERMHALLNKTNAAIDAITANKKDAPHPIDVALQFHLDYVIIHPFYDGNGRTARILTNLLLISFGYPPFWVKTNERNIYNQYIGDIQGYGGNPDLFMEFGADMILRSEELVWDAIEGKEIIEDEDIDKEIAMFKKQFGEDKNLTEKSTQVLIDLYNQSLSKLFKLFQDKLHQFDDMFAKKAISVNFSSRNDRQYKFTTIDELFQTMDSHSKMSPTEINLNEVYTILDLDNIALRVSFEAFKHDGINTFWADSELRVFFEKYSYVITDKGSYSDDNYLVKKLYSSTLTDGEIKKIVQSCVADTFANIKSSIKNRN